MDLSIYEQVEQDIPLADFMKRETWALHSEAETTGIVADIIQGHVSLTDYVHYIHNLHFVYAALESDLEWLKFYPELRKFVAKNIYRASQLKQDSHQLRQQHNMSLPSELMPETRAYCDYIKYCQSHEPELMTAHIYVRYLGDLNGGQIMKRLLKSSLKLNDDSLTFYDFLDVEDVKIFRDSFRECINRIILPTDALEKVKKAAQDIFQFNISLSKSCKIGLSDVLDA